MKRAPFSAQCFLQRGAVRQGGNVKCSMYNVQCFFVKCAVEERRNEKFVV